jgi:hypothetical protein
VVAAPTSIFIGAVTGGMHTAVIDVASSVVAKQPGRHITITGNQKRGQQIIGTRRRNVGRDVERFAWGIILPKI